MCVIGLVQFKKIHCKLYGVTVFLIYRVPYIKPHSLHLLHLLQHLGCMWEEDFCYVCEC